MLIMPKRGLRVCLHCGKVLRSNQVIDSIFNGKKVKACPYCGEPEKISTGNDIINDYISLIDDIVEALEFEEYEI